MAEVFKTNCRKCGHQFDSQDERDQDGDGICPDCEVQRQEAIKKTQAQMDIIKANRPPQVRKELPPSGKWISAREILL